LRGLSYQFSKTVTKRIIEDVFHAVRIHAFIMHQRIKLAGRLPAFIGRERCEDGPEPTAQGPLK
jgi:hypothetical protein